MKMFAVCHLIKCKLRCLTVLMPTRKKGLFAESVQEMNECIYFKNHHLHLKRIKTLFSSAKCVEMLNDLILYTLRDLMLFIKNMVHVWM